MKKKKKNKKKKKKKKKKEKQKKKKKKKNSKEKKKNKQKIQKLKRKTICNNDVTKIDNKITQDQKFRIKFRNCFDRKKGFKEIILQPNICRGIERYVR